MTLEEFDSYTTQYKYQIRSLAYRLHKNNPEYSIQEIITMLMTAIWETPKPTSQTIYFVVLNRILDEKGFCYLNGKLTKLTTPLEDNQGTTESIQCPPIIQANNKVLLDTIMQEAKLDQDEVFVTALAHQLSTPSVLKGKWKTILDNIDPLYNIRPLTYKEISAIMGIPIQIVSQLKKSAISKLERYCGNK